MDATVLPVCSLGPVATAGALAARCAGSGVREGDAARYWMSSKMAALFRQASES